MIRSLITIASVASLVASASAQINYAESFAASAAGWTVAGGFSPGYKAAGGCGGGSLGTNLYQPGTQGNFTSPSLGTSIGGTITLTFNYKVWQYGTAQSPAAAPFGATNVQYGASATGPWTTVGSFSDEAQSASCIAKSFTFSAPAGALFVRLNNVYSSGDNWWHFDDVTAVESGGGACSGTPAPGNTVAPASVCPGATFSLSLQNTTSGTGLTYQWYSSTVGASGPWTAVGTGIPSLSTSQTVDTWYYCDVTCGGTATGSSAVAFVPMSSPAASQGWDGGSITPNCWSTGGTFPPVLSTASAFGVGAGSVKFDFYNGVAGSTMTLTSPTFAALGAGQKIYFDVAGRTYINEVDTVALEESNDGGTTWTTVVVMTNQTNFQGVLATLNAATPGYTPVAADWASLAYPLSAGTNRVRFNALSAYGNNCYLDNVSIGVLPSARHTKYGASCAAGFAISAAPAPVTGTTVTFSQAGIPEAATGSGIYFGVVVLSLGQLQPGVPLNLLTAGAIDSPCNLNVASTDLLLSFVSLAPTDSSVSFAVPAAAPAGVLLYAQSAALVTPAAPNNAGIVTSNGIRSFINTF